MAKVTIGDRTYTVLELNFTALEKAWPFIEESMLTQDPMKGPSAGLSVIAAGLVYSDDFKPGEFGMPENNSMTEDEMFDYLVPWLKRRLKSSQIQNIVTCMDEITEEAGLGSKKGEDQAPEKESPSTETVVASSPSLSQQELKEAVGVK